MPGGYTAKRKLQTMAGGETVSSSRSKIVRTCQKSCLECNKLASNNGGDEENFLMVCQKCEDCYHSKCVQIRSAFVIEEIKRGRFKWTCYKCHITLLDNIDQMSSKMEDINTSYQMMSNQLKELNLLTSTYEQAVQNLSKKIDDQKMETDHRLTEIETVITNNAIDLKEVLEQMRCEIEELKQKTCSNCQNPNPDDKLTTQVNYLSNIQRRNDLVIQGIPTLPVESDVLLKEAIVKLANSCGMPMKSTDIKNVHRMKKPGNNDDPTKSASILVRFNGTDVIKEEFFMKYLNKLTEGNGLTLSCLGLLPPTKRIYINHHISAELMKVKKKALEMKKGKIIERVTTRYNMIRIQKDNQWHKITSLQQLDTLLPVHQPMNIDA